MLDLREAEGQRAVGEGDDLRWAQRAWEVERHAIRIRRGSDAAGHPPPEGEKEEYPPAPSITEVADLRRSTRWAGLRPGDPVQVDGTRLRGASWEFVAHVTNGETGEVWVEVVGGRAGDRAGRSFRPDQLYR